MLNVFCGKNVIIKQQYREMMQGKIFIEQAYIKQIWVLKEKLQTSV